MFGFISKRKVQKLITNGLIQLEEAENKVFSMTDEEINEDYQDYINSLNRIEGAKEGLRGLLKHFL